MASIHSPRGKGADSMSHSKRRCLFAIVTGLVMLAGSAWASTPDGQTPAEESVCDSHTGAAFGLCNAYCEAMDCDSASPHASARACARVAEHFERITGIPLFCGPHCPCWNAAGTFFFGEGEGQGPMDLCGTESFPDLELQTEDYPEELEVEGEGCEVKVSDLAEAAFCSYEGEIQCNPEFGDDCGIANNITADEVRGCQIALCALVGLGPDECPPEEDPAGL